MCPDEQLLSLYIDDEIDSPYKEKLESHLSQCSTCQKKLAQLGSLSLLIRGNTVNQQRAIEARLAARLAPHMEKTVSYPTINFSPKQWQRIAIPAAAAAAILIIALGVFNPLASTTSDTVAQVQANEGVLVSSDELQSYLQQNNHNIAMEVDFSNDSSLSTVGDPVIVMPVGNR